MTTNSINVSWAVWSDAKRRWDNWVKQHRSNPNWVLVNGNRIQPAAWLDSQRRVTAWQNANRRNPATVRLDLPTQPARDATATREIIPVFNFNQMNVGRGFGPVSCGPVAALICASGLQDNINNSTFLTHAYGLINAMSTRISPNPGTGPNELVSGFNRYFKNLVMERQPVTEANIRDNIRNNRLMVFNMLTNSSFGYVGRFGHYMAISGYNGRVGVNDPAGASRGRGTRQWYNYSTVKQAIDANGSRPLFVVRRK